MQTNQAERRNKLRQVVVYTDGSCLGNPGRGGYGVVLKYPERLKELSGGYQLTTNNRMEIMAAIIGLEAMKERCAVTVFSDSRYLVRAIEEGWVLRWQASGWMRNERERALNVDLWERLLKVCRGHEVEFKWVKGHAGDAGNERADQLATEAASLPDLPRDEGYGRSEPARGPDPMLP